MRAERLYQFGEWPDDGGEAMQMLVDLMDSGVLVPVEAVIERVNQLSSHVPGLPQYVLTLPGPGRYAIVRPTEAVDE